MGTRGDVLTVQISDRFSNVAGGRNGNVLGRIERPLVSCLQLDWKRERCRASRQLETSTRAIQGNSSNAGRLFEIGCSFFSGDELHWDHLRTEAEGLHTGSWWSGGRQNLTVVAADFYKTLGISKSATKQEIKSAYRRLARQYHPDVNKQPGAEDKFKEISNAYEILSDDEKRPLYDQFGEAGVKDAARGPGAGAYATNPFDLFESFFGGSMGGLGGMGGSGFGTRRRSAVVQGDDIRYDMTLEFTEAIFGTEKDFEAVHLETCGICDGSGAKAGTSRKSCTTCGGMGQVMSTQETPFGTFSQVSTCSTCAGEGEVIYEYCRKCGGEGRIRLKKNMKVKIPAGVNSGSTLRVRGEGDTGPRGGPAGDLYVFLNVKEAPGIQRDGMSLYSNVSISFTDAILGTVVKVRTVDGVTELQIPSGTQPGDVLVLSKMGAPKLNKPTNRGDHFFTVKVTIPSRLSDAERKLVEELAYLQKAKSGYRGSSLNSRPQPQRKKTAQEASKFSAYEKEHAGNNTAIKKPEREEEGVWGTIKNIAGSAATGALKWLREKL